MPKKVAVIDLVVAIGGIGTVVCLPKEVAVFLRELAGEFGLQFIIGIGDKSRGIAEDLFSITSGPVDIERLQAIIGVAPK